METSPTLGELAKALSQAQNEMSHARVDSLNPHFKSRYASLTAVMDAARPILSKHGLAIVQAASYSEGMAHVQTMILHLSGEFIRETLSIKPAREDAQALGSAVTYLRRFSICSLAGVAPQEPFEDDDGEAAVGRAPTNKPADPKLVVVKNQKPAAQTTKTTKVADQTPTNNPAPASAGNQPNPSIGKNAQHRVAKIRQIFTASAALGHGPQAMKAAIGQILGLNRPIKESAEIKDADLDRILDAFNADLAKIEKEAA